MRAGVGGQHRMARPYSQDLRNRVVSSVASGRPCRATPALFGGRVASEAKRAERGWLLARVAEKPDLTLRAVVAEVAERGAPASYGAVLRVFRREGITYKK